MPKVKRANLIDLLKEKFDGKVRICTIVAKTVPPMWKTNNPFIAAGISVHKLARVNVLAGRVDYQNSVNRQREREGHPDQFLSVARTWGKRDRSGPFVLKDGEIHSVELKVQRVLESMYTVDNVAATPKQVETIKSFLPVKGESARQELNNPVILRDYKLESLIQIHVDGKAYIVTD
jgi:hypothetical protein